MGGDTNGAGFALPAVPLEPLRDRDPRELGPFRLLGRLGAGGMGVAFLAEGGGQWAVVKMVRSELAEDRSFRARLSRELDAMGRASGPHTASLLDSDVQADPPWFAMEFIPGMTLTRRVDDSGALVMAEVVALAVAMVDVLVSVHGAGIVHRDLKPSNIMMSPTGPKLIDFGIADMSEGTQLTKTGMVLGSTGWLAPEQVRGDQVTSATDIHAWALCVLYAATGAPPFGADNSTATMYKVLEAIPVIPQEIPSPLRELLSAAVAKEPSHRPTLERLSSELNPVQVQVAPAPTTPVFDTTPTPAQDMLTTLEAAPRPPGRTAPGAADTSRPAGRRWWPVAVGIGALCVVAAVVVVLAGRNSSTSIAPTTQNASATAAASSAPASASDAQAASSPAPIASNKPIPVPVYAVDVDYADANISDSVQNNTLDWEFDVCSDDSQLLTASTLGKVALYEKVNGKWVKQRSEIDAQAGGRCGAKMVQLIVAATEPTPNADTVGTGWSSCSDYRVTIPETTTYAKTSVDMCVRTRATLEGTP